MESSITIGAGCALLVSFISVSISLFNIFHKETYTAELTDSSKMFAYQPPKETLQTLTSLQDSIQDKNKFLEILGYRAEATVNSNAPCLQVVYNVSSNMVSSERKTNKICVNFDEKDIVKFGGKLFVREPYKFGGIHYDEKVNLFELAVNYLNAGKFAMQPVIVNELPSVGNYPFNAFYFQVPEGEFFMIGDNRDHSNDSRFWGPVAYKNIVGKPWFVYFSWDDEYKIRWNRVGKSVDFIQNSPELLDAARAEAKNDGNKIE